MRNTYLYLIAAASLTAVLSTSAGAASTEEYDVLLKASVPSDNFHVRPVESGWIGERQEMVYDLATEKLQPLKKLFQFKNTAGAIKATLLNTDADGAPLLFNASKSIKLAVKFNNVAITHEGDTVVTAEEAKTGGRANLDISTANNAVLPSATYAGEYTGTVSINFEPVVSAPSP